MIKIAIDANEANVSNRVGSNVYAFRLIEELYKLTTKRKNIDITVLLSSPKLADLPKKRKNWRYLVITPKKFWTQWALPIHLFLHQDDYDLLFTPGHYAPRISAVPYVSSVMDLAYIDFPDQFKKNDLIQLTNWTKYSVKNAKKVVTISQFSKKEIIKHYQRDKNDIAVIYPDAQLTDSADATAVKKFFKETGIQRKYFLYLGTLQPRKNIIKLVDAYEKYYRKTAAYNLENKKKYQTKNKKEIPQLVIAGKIGWLADEILERIEKSPFKEHIVLTGFVEDQYKAALYKNAQANLLLMKVSAFHL
jgi:glycosyltransferase involved in cell wall biosynthesis